MTPEQARALLYLIADLARAIYAPSPTSNNGVEAEDKKMEESRGVPG
jgi:hypothetical protein